MPSTEPTLFDKPALSLADQVRQLISKGMQINDPAAAENVLTNVSYYRLSAYWVPFLQLNVSGQRCNTLRPGTSFEEVLALYEFDRQLRLLVLDALEHVEVALRSAMTYHVVTAYGAFGHENPANFHPAFDHASWITKLHDETNRSSDTFVIHYKNSHQGFPAMPLWMSTELISLGSLSKLYSGMKPTDKRTIATPLNLHHKRLQNWLHVLTYVRNVCAHHSRLWNRELSIRASVMSESEWRPPLLPRLDRLFYVLLILRLLLRKTDRGTWWRDQCQTLLQPVAETPKWRTAMGMGVDWQNHPLWI
jgi:abortive infection bacteriophage resistance protein